MGGAGQRLARLLVAAVAACAALAPGASAATDVHVDGASLIVRGGAAESSDLRIYREGEDLVVYEYTGTVVPGAGCTTPASLQHPGASAAACPAGGVGAIFIDMGDQDDRITEIEPPLPATIDMGTGNDYIMGTAGPDTIFLGEGNDTATFGSPGNDTFYGGPGDDNIADGSLENSTDVMYGGSGDDRFYGGGGDDKLFGEEGADILADGPGDDRVEAGADADTLEGGEGDDTLDGGDGNDVMGDEKGNNTLRGDLGNDRLTTGDGADVLDGGDGDDRLRSGEGDDQLMAGSGDNDLVGGGGNDTLVSEDGDDDLLGEDGDDRMTAGEGDDKLLGGRGDDVIDAGAGDDQIDADRGSDTVDSRDGFADQEVTCGPAADTVISDSRDPVRVDCERIHGSSVALTSDGSIVLSLSCPSGCSGRLALALDSRGPSASPAAVSLGRRSFSLRPARRGAVRLRLPEKAVAKARAYADAHRGRPLRLTAKGSVRELGGQRTPLTATYRLRVR